MSAPALPDDALESGTVLDGRYRIDGVIGGGGMARVYRAEHLKIARPVAIKVLHADHSQNRDAVARFQREATTSGRLVHPNIVTVTDFGVLPDGRCFLVMEALEGETLADRLDREDRIPWRTAVTFLEELLLGLRYAHERGVVHRDIKPENLFLLRGEERPLLKILDFGIARLQDALPGGDRITRSGLTLGTPIYMSPEQTVDGEITPVSDLYSSTVVLVEMLTGDPPFYFDDPIATMKAHLHKTPPTIRELAPELDIPEGLEEIVRRGLAKMAAERIPSADAYLRMIDRLWDPESLQLRGLRRAVTPPAGHAAAMPPADDPSAIPQAGYWSATPPAGYRTAPPPSTPPAGRTTTAPPGYWAAPPPPGTPPAGYWAVPPPPGTPPGTPPAGYWVPAPPAGYEGAVPSAVDPAARQSGMVLLPPALGGERDMLDAAAQERDRRRKRLLAVGALLLAGSLGFVTHQVLRLLTDDGRGAVPPPAASSGAAAPAASPAPSPLAASPALPSEHAPNAGDAGDAGDAAPSAVPSGSSAQPAGAGRALSPPDPRKPRDPEQAKRSVAEGNAALAGGRFAAAGAQFQRAVAADPTAHAGHAGLSEVAYNQGDFQRAVLSGKRAVALAPRVAGYRMTLAKAYYKLLQYDDAIAQWRKVLELEPANDRAKKNIEMARAKKGG